MIVPAQAIEDRNHPHAGRTVTYLRENARTLNEPVAKVMTKSSATGSKDQERRWWEWNTVTGTQQEDPKRRNNKRSQSNAPSVHHNNNNNNNNNAYESSSSSSSSANEYPNGSSNGFQTTYQKDLNYVRDIPNSGGGGQATRHGSNPNTREAVGIVPVNDLTAYSRPGEEQRVFVDKMSFEHQYDSRKDNNYPNVGKVSFTKFFKQELF